MTGSRRVRTWALVVVFAAAMAWMEAATVYYLRTLVDRVYPYQANPLPIRGVLIPVELIREAATLIMLFAVGTLASRRWLTRLGYTAIAFGVWDILYYVFLRAMSDWPRSLFDWDVLFLLPLPWWGPVLAPVSIAALMVLWGTLVTQVRDDRVFLPPSSVAWRLSLLGIALALYVFMADSLHLLHRGIDTARQVLPTRFNWPLFFVALVLMAMPVLHIVRAIRVGNLSSPLSPERRAL
jgi:hypothetical protein